MKNYIEVQTKVIRELNARYHIDILDMSDQALKVVMTQFDYVRLNDAIRYGIEHNEIETCPDCGEKISNCTGYKCWIK